MTDGLALFEGLNGERRQITEPVCAICPASAPLDVVR